MTYRQSNLVNILFQETQTLSPSRLHQNKQLEFYHINKIIEENVFIPRHKYKHIRVLKINQTLANKPVDIAKTTANFNKIFVDGSHVRQLSPTRYVSTHQQYRNRYDGGTKIEKDESSWAKFEEKLKLKMQEQQSKKVNKARLYQSVQINLEEADESTASSSNRNIQVLIHQRGIPQKQEKPRERHILNIKPSLTLKKQMFRLYSSPVCSPENITAKAYIVYEHIGSNKSKIEGKCIHAAFNIKVNLQIASLTKIMTCLLAVQTCEKHQIDISREQVEIGYFQTRVEGTSADLASGDIYTVQQLLYGLMLPSGNDASIALSVFCGQLMERGSNRNKNVKDSLIARKKSYFRRFVMQMNKKCMQLGLKRTVFTNSHGLSNSLSKCCVSDLAGIIDHSLRNKIFRKIVQCREYTAEVKQCGQNGQITCKTNKWTNTHKFVHSLPEVYKGIKTGTTEAAGPCLASLIQMRGRQFVIVVLDSKSLKLRYKDTERLREWVRAKEGL